MSLKLKILLEIEVNSATECGKCKGNIKTLPGISDSQTDFCMYFKRSLLHNYEHKLMRIPDCMNATKPTK